MVYGADGELVGKFSDTETLNLATPDDVKAFRNRPYHYDRQIDLPAGKYSFRVAFGSGRESLGKVEAPLAIEGWDGKSLAISGIALSKETRKAAGLALELDPSLLEGHHPLIASSLEIVPSGENRCRRAEQCFGYVEVYDSSLANAGSRPPQVRIAILDRQTRRELVSGALDVTTSRRTGSPSAPAIFRVPAGQLPAGTYTLELRATSGAATATRAVDLTIE